MSIRDLENKNYYYQILFRHNETISKGGMSRFKLELEPDGVKVFSSQKLNFELNGQKIQGNYAVWTKYNFKTNIHYSSVGGNSNGVAFDAKSKIVKNSVSYQIKEGNSVRDLTLKCSADGYVFDYLPVFILNRIIKNKKETFMNVINQSLNDFDRYKITLDDEVDEIKTSIGSYSCNNYSLAVENRATKEFIDIGNLYYCEKTGIMVMSDLGQQVMKLVKIEDC